MNLNRTALNSVPLRLAILGGLLGAVFACGCSRGEPNQDVSAGHSNADSASQSATHSASNDDMHRLITAARQLEGQEKWLQAAELWEDVHDQTASLFGTDSWQAKNASLAISVARSTAGFDKKQKQVSESLAARQIKLQKLIEQHKIPAAMSLSEEIVSVARQLHGIGNGEQPTSHITANKLERHAELQAATGGYQEASDSLHEAIAIRRRVLGSVHPDYERAAFSLGNLYSQTDEVNQAISQFREVHKIALQLWGEQSGRVAMIKNELGVLLSRQERFEEAKRYIQSAASTRKTLFGADSQPFAQSQLNLGVIENSSGDYAAAVPYLQSVVEAIDANPKNAEDTMLCVGTYSNLGTAQLHIKDFSGAEKTLLKLAKTTMKTHGDEHPIYAGSLLQLAIATSQLGNAEAAEALFEKSIEIQRTMLSPNHPDLLWSIETYAKTLENSGRLQEAINVRRLIPKGGETFAGQNVATKPEKVRADFGGGTFQR